MRSISVVALVWAGAVFCANAAAADTLDDKACYGRFAAATRYLRPGSPEKIAMGRHGIELNHKFLDGLSDDQAEAVKKENRAELDRVLDMVKNGSLGVEQLFADVNACETRLGMTVSKLEAYAAP